MRAKDPCPCKSGALYIDCCRPAHTGEVAPKCPQDLVRARYAAFALGLGEFLHATLGEGHPDRVPPSPLSTPAEVAARVAELSRAGRSLKYMGVSILESDEDEALFLAKVFQKGADRSFAELSSFAWQDGILRYTGGRLLPRTALPETWGSMTRATFRDLSEGHPALVVG